MIVIAVRWALTLAILIGVYSETGPWTTCSIGMICAYIELRALVRTRGEL